MYRALSTRHVGSSTSRALGRVTKRRITTESAESAPIIPKKKKRIFRRVILATTALTGTFYVSSAFVAFNNQKYYDIFSDLPLGQSTLEWAEARGLDELTQQQILDSPATAYRAIQNFITRTADKTPTRQDAVDAVEKAKSGAERRAREAKVAATGAFKESKAIAHSVAAHIKTDVRKSEEKLHGVAKHQQKQIDETVDELIRKAEAALADKPPQTITAKDTPPVATKPSTSTSPLENDSSSAAIDETHIYTSPLPIGFELPPGFSRPAPPASKKETAPSTAEPSSPHLPLVAPAIAELGTAEPVISQIASTIDDLVSYLDSSPAASAKAKDVLDAAKTDLTALATRIDKVKEEEHSQLVAKLDEQAKQYNSKLLELEMQSQDRLDDQEDGFRKFFDEEKAKILQAYRDKLDNELRTQTELINERLKEEVIAQGIELQRRWIREIKVRVENERGGRLGKLDQLAGQLHRLERVASDNATYLDENLRVHALWSALRALGNAVDAPVRKPFREELRVLRHIAAAREDPVVASALDSLESTNVPDVGIEPFADLASWFSTAVAPKVVSVALVPDVNAGVLSYLASHFLSSFRFQRHGLVPGGDVLSVLARAEYHMNEKDLDSAARELNQLNGAAKVLLEDWLAAARKRLEVQQALEVVQTQATLASLLVL